MAEPTKDTVSPWVPMSDPLDLKHLGKLQEELGEAIAAVARCLIQGIDGSEPLTGKLNREWLENELADVEANIGLVIEHFKLDEEAIAVRAMRKAKLLKRWHTMTPRKPASCLHPFHTMAAGDQGRCPSCGDWVHTDPVMG